MVTMDELDAVPSTLRVLVRHETGKRRGVDHVCRETVSVVLDHLVVELDDPGKGHIETQGGRYPGRAKSWQAALLQRVKAYGHDLAHVGSQKACPERSGHEL